MREAAAAEKETVTILDDEPEAGAAAPGDNAVGQDRADDDATESDGGRERQSVRSSLRRQTR
eukprot:614440-Rhodomonas_salina.1